VLGEVDEEQKPAVGAGAAAEAAASAMEASAPVEPSPVQSPGNEEVTYLILPDVQPEKRKVTIDIAQKTKDKHKNCQIRKGKSKRNAQRT